MEIKILKQHKSIKPSSETLILPKFCVLTGKNGSGKSHFLESLSHSEIAQVIEDEKNFTEIKYIRFGELNPQINADSNYQDFINQAKNIWTRVRQNLTGYKSAKLKNPNAHIENYIPYIKEAKILADFEKHFPDIEEWTEDFFLTHFDFNSLTQGQFFSSQFASVFKIYWNRMLHNLEMETLNNEYGQNNPVLTPAEFEKVYGPEPWDLINQMMENAHLPYIVNNPEGETTDSVFHMYLTDTKRDIKIDVNDLSTGEKVLMSLAIAIYNTAEQGVKPDLLLIDEPDAPLHPEFSKFLIDTIKNLIVEKAGVNVIITTHSPTTVAMSDEESIFRMNKDKGRPEKVSKSEAIAILTSGLDNVRVSIENRRQVLVESRYDVEYYTKIYNLLNSSLDFQSKYDLKFLEATNREGCNCEDVKTIVKAFRDAGNETVYGIIDYDNHNVSENYIFVIGQRYAIENYIFDPIFIGFLLLREHICSSSDFSLQQNYTYIKLRDIIHDDLQRLINFVVSKLGFSTDENVIEYEVVKGEKYSMNKSFFEMQGHDLEDKLINVYPKLKSITKNRTNDNLLKNYVISTVITDFPYYLSVDIRELFDSINMSV